MRGPTPEEILTTPPPAMRIGSKTTQAYLDMRKKILTGVYEVDQIITPKDVDAEYKISNTSTQLILFRLASEGLIKVLPVRERKWTNNAVQNEYHVADLNVRHRMFSTRHGDFVADISQGGYPAYKQTETLEVQHADAEVARLLNIAEGDNVIFHRNLQRRDKDTIVCINDTYLPFWFAEVLPELKKPDSDIYDLARKLGRKPYWCTETVDVVLASSIEREKFGLSSDDPATLLKILRQAFDPDGNPIDVQFLTDRGDIYRLHYSFPLYAKDIPET